MPVFTQIRHIFKRNKMADVKEFLAITSEFLRFYINFGYILQCKN